MERCALVAAVLVTLAGTVPGAQAIQCYQCSITPPPMEIAGELKRLCQHFDGSDQYVVDCPYSTMCMKQDFHLEIQNEVRIDGVLRDCAPQKHDFQEYRDRRWWPRTEILEPYEEGCQNVDDKGERISSTRYCYCRSNLCNAAPATSSDAYTDAMAIIVVFNLLKYIRSLQ